MTSAIAHETKFLAVERETLDALLPGLADALGTTSLGELESPGSPAIAHFREAGGPALLIPAEHGGRGATALEAIRVQRAIGSRCPSLGVASTMHHFSVATLLEMCLHGSGLEWLLVEAIAKQNLLVASGFAEGLSGRGILAPTMEARPTASGYVVSGSKKPCSLSRSMDLMTVSVTIRDTDDADASFAVLLVPASSSGIGRRPFWATDVLAGAESDEVILEEVEVPERLAFAIGDGGADPDPVQIAGFLWFELLITAAYLGMASGLAERAITAGKGDQLERVLLAIELESAMAALEGVARAMSDGRRNEDDLARVLFVRYSVQRTIERATARAAELLGGMAFIRSADVARLLASARGLAFHPPSRTSIAPALASYLSGGRLEVE